MQKNTQKNKKVPEDGGLGTVSAVAAYLDVSRSKVYAMMEAGLLAYVKLGKSRRIPWDAVTNLVSQNTVGVAD